MKIRIMAATAMGFLSALPAGAQHVDDGGATFVSPCAAPTQDAFCPYSPAADAKEAFLHLQASLGALNERVVSDPDLNAATASTIQSQINELQDLFSVRASRPAEATYVGSLDDLAVALLLAARSDDPATANGILLQVRDDLDVKLESARASFGATGNTPATARVTVKTMLGSAAATGYRVACLPAYYAGGTPTISFNGLTNPTLVASLSPGIYEVVVYKAGQASPVSRSIHRVSLKDGGPALILLVVSQ